MDRADFGFFRFLRFLRFFGFLSGNFLVIRLVFSPDLGIKYALPDSAVWEVPVSGFGLVVDEPGLDAGAEGVVEFLLGSLGGFPLPDDLAGLGFILESRSSAPSPRGETEERQADDGKFTSGHLVSGLNGFKPA